MISCKLCGGLGNQLFQIFTAISYALRYNKSFFFLNNYQLGSGTNGETIRYTYWKTFLADLRPFLKNKNDLPELTIQYETDFAYKELSASSTDLLLVGYFQSYKYFDMYKNMICKLLKLEAKKNQVKTKYAFNFNDIHSISMHFRFGDYKHYPSVYNLLVYDYYKDALQYIILRMIETNIERKEIFVFYFCEEESMNDAKPILDKLTKSFPKITFVKADRTMEDWEQLLFMSLCEHNIIANSTFSWWGAYLNSNDDKIVCYPEQWFAPEVTNKPLHDLCLDYWVAI
jgi:hypothetical protein